ncbi:Inner membrane protein yfdC [Serratia fonticola]|uniref:Inner membrane protein yfdC n=1 Tax=Serratia fonticola TaxID=47917 RepID=A0A4U9UKV3_SERFO|nr:Inner membrane protein yfdC [Serratia fonticola]
MEGEKELERDWLALLLSASGGWLVDGASLAAKGIFHARLPDDPSRFFIENIGYTFGFIIVIMARQQLFTENTVTAVLPIMHKPTPKNFVILFRLWGIVLLGNLIGTGLAALAFIYMPIFDENTRAAFTSLSQEIMHNTPGEMFANGILAGWIIATMVWMFPSARAAKIWVIVLMTYLVAICDLTHIVVGSVEILYLVFSGALPWQEFFYPFAIPTLAGNIIGGSFIFALISHAQIRNDMSDKAKAERLKAQQEKKPKEDTDRQ